MIRQKMFNNHLVGGIGHMFFHESVDFQRKLQKFINFNDNQKSDLPTFIPHLESCWIKSSISKVFEQELLERGVQFSNVFEKAGGLNM